MWQFFALSAAPALFSLTQHWTQCIVITVSITLNSSGPGKMFRLLCQSLLYTYFLVAKSNEHSPVLINTASVVFGITQHSTWHCPSLVSVTSMSSAFLPLFASPFFFFLSFFFWCFFLLKSFTVFNVLSLLSNLVNQPPKYSSSHFSPFSPSLSFCTQSFNLNRALIIKPRWP